MNTFYSKVKAELESLGYTITKQIECSSSAYWTFCEDGVELERSRYLGELLRSVGKQFGIV